MPIIEQAKKPQAINLKPSVHFSIPLNHQPYTPPPKLLALNLAPKISVPKHYIPENYVPESSVPKSSLPKKKCTQSLSLPHQALHTKHGARKKCTLDPEPLSVEPLTLNPKPWNPKAPNPGSHHEASDAEHGDGKEVQHQRQRVRLQAAQQRDGPGRHRPVYQVMGRGL